MPRSTTSVHILFLPMKDWATLNPSLFMLAEFNATCIAIVYTFPCMFVHANLIPKKEEKTIVCKSLCFGLKPAVSWNIALHSSPSSRHSSFLISAILLHQFIPANPPGFPGIFPILTRSPDFSISIVIVFFLLFF